MAMKSTLKESQKNFSSGTLCGKSRIQHKTLPTLMPLFTQLITPSMCTSKRALTGSIC